jgi:protein TonB
MKTNPVKSRYAVPVAVAISAHAFLFFGFNPVRPPPIKTIPTDIGIPVKFAPPPDLDPIPPQPGDNEAKPSDPKPVAGPPVQEEIISPLVPNGAITVPFEPITTGPIVPGLMAIPPGYGRDDGPGDDLTHIMHPIDLDKAPHALFQARPTYPYSLKTSGVSGEVLVDFLVDEQGRVNDVRVVRSTHHDFEETTMRAVAKWRFEPGKRHGRVVRFRMSLPVAFTVGD